MPKNTTYVDINFTDFYEKYLINYK